MAVTIPNLWPTAEIDLEVLTPLAILRAQATQLQEFTRGLLEAEVEVVSTEKLTEAHLDIIAPALNRYRQRIFTLSYRNKNVYPVYLNNMDDEVNYEDMYDGEDLGLYSDKEFMNALRDSLTSPRVKAILSSLIARSNEEKEFFANELPPVSRAVPARPALRTAPPLVSNKQDDSVENETAA